MDEITLTRELGRETPLPSPDRLAPARARLMSELTVVPARHRGRRRWAIIATGAVAAAAAGIVSIVSGTPSDRPAPPASTSDPRMVQVARFLDGAATVAARTRDVVPRPDQFIYTRLVGADGLRTETWTSIDGEHLGRTRSSDGTTATIAACVNGRHYDPGDPVDVGCDPTRRYRPDLPIDPDGMAAWLTARNPGVDGAPYNANGVAKDVGDLSSDFWLRPAQRAALYRALGRFDAITLVPGAEDATGRKGTGVAWVEPGATKPRVMWVFDPARHELIGFGNGSVEAYGLVDRVGATG